MCAGVDSVPTPWPAHRFPYIRRCARGAARLLPLVHRACPAPGRARSPNIVVDELRARGRKVELLDGDEVREHLSKGLGFSKEDRDTNIRRIGWVASVLARNGVVSVTAAISPYRAVRDEVRGWIDNFVEIHVATSLEECEARDVKGLYAKARAGEIPEFTGVSDPYEPPVAPEIRARDRGPHAPPSRRPRSSPGSKAHGLGVGRRRRHAQWRIRSGSGVAPGVARRRRGRRRTHPVATSRSPAAAPTTCAGTPAAAARAAHLGAVFAGSTLHDDDRRRLGEARLGGRAAVERRARPGRRRSPAIAISASATARPPSLHVVHTVAPRGRARASATSSCSARGRVEIGAGRHAAVETVHDRGPLRAAELGPHRRRARRCRRRRATRAAGGRSCSSSIRPSTPTTGVGWMSSPLDSL